MSEASNKRSEEFLKISAQFKLGSLVTESSHPLTANLSDVAKQDIAQALDLLFQVDGDVLKTYREFVGSGRAGDISGVVVRALKNGGRIFFTGCGSTGRLSIQLVSIWRDFWRNHFKIPSPLRSAGEGELSISTSSPRPSPPLHGGEGAEPWQTESTSSLPSIADSTLRDWEQRAFSVMAGGDFALIKSVEGFEDFAAFGRKQLQDLGVNRNDVVFAITEGGETSFVIGTAWKAVEASAKVYFVYNNPDELLCAHVERSREVIQDSRIEKINLTTGPMAITGSTRMQATTIQLCVLLTVLEMVVRDLLEVPAPVGPRFLAALSEMHVALRSTETLAALAQLVALEESVYRSGHKNNYYADRFAIDVLTDTTERSPTYCTPPFRKSGDNTAASSWAFLFVPDANTPDAWNRILKRAPVCVDWKDDEVRELVGADRAAATMDIIRKIKRDELMRFRVGLDGAGERILGSGDSAIAILAGSEKDSVLSLTGFYRTQLEAARNSGARVGLVAFGEAAVLRELEAFVSRYERGEWNLAPAVGGSAAVASSGQAGTGFVRVLVPVSAAGFLLDGVTRVGLKMLLNALSTCTMVRLGRVMGNYMIWVVASNLKLIDRATRYIQKLAGLSYESANQLLFEVVEYVEPRMKSDQAYPPVVALAVLRAKHRLTNEEAEQRLGELD